MWAILRQGCFNFKLSKHVLLFSNDALVAQKLNERTLLRLNGNDAQIYMQGLITNDMTHLQDKTSSIFTMFLNSKGRVLYDTIIYKTFDKYTFLIECDKAAALPLKDHILHFKIRRKINIDLVSDEFDIWVTSKNNDLPDQNNISDFKKIASLLQNNIPNTIITIDPRLGNMGLRILMQKDTDFMNVIEKIINLKIKEENFYKLLRYKFGVAEGVQELPFEKCFPLEVNGDYMHGISFHKGCYIGQELTARTYHTGVIRKRIMPIKFNESLPSHKSYEHGVPIYSSKESNKSIGKLFGVEQSQGIAMLRIEEALKAEELIIDKNKCKTYRPFWWPKEAPKTRMNVG